MNVPLTTILTAAALAAPSIAQTTVVFPTDAGSSGSSNETRFPFAYGVSRCMGVYANWDLNVPNGATITAVGFRQEVGRTSPATGVQVEVLMGPAGTTSNTVDFTFDNNYLSGSTPTSVFGPSIVNLPAGDPNAATPQTIMLQLTTPYVYDDTQGLVVEFRVTANSNGNQQFSYFLDRHEFTSPVTPFGQGCQSSAGQVPQLTLRPTAIGSSLIADISQAPASSFVYLNLNTSSSPSLPGGPFGAPGCTLYVPPILVETLQAGSTSGSARFTIPVPYNTIFYRQDVFAQALIADLFANNLGFVASNASQITIGARGPMGLVFSSGSASATTGSPQRDRGVVTLFEYQ